MGIAERNFQLLIFKLTRTVWSARLFIWRSALKLSGQTTLSTCLRLPLSNLVRAQITDVAYLAYTNRKINVYSASPVTQ